MIIRVVILIFMLVITSLTCESSLAQEGAPPPTTFSREPAGGRIAANNPLPPIPDPISLGGAAEDSNVTAEEQAGTIEANSLISIFRRGGVPMFAIVSCSIVLVIFAMERGFFLRKTRVMPRLFVRGVLEQLEQQQIAQEEALELCEENASPIAELFETALKKWGRPAVEIEQAVMDAGEHVTSQLRRYLRLFSTIANLAPLLGLLGTVLGMIDAFNAIAQADAMGRPEMLASGIGGALLTTAAGLCVAIPAYTAYAYFVGRSDQLILEMDKLSQSLIELVCAEAQGTKKRTRKVA